MEQKIITTDWIEIDSNNFKTTRKDMIRGMPVELSVSPYDVPIAVRGLLDKLNQRVTIEFKYLSSEPTVLEKHDRFVQYKKGKFSRRLYGIVIDLAAIQQDQRHNFNKYDKVLSAFNDLVQSSQMPEKDNYELAKDAVRSNKGELLAAI